jgi:hypothetical protein
VCSSDASCAGYPLAYCDGVCKCREGSLNAGSACIQGVDGQPNGVQQGTCPADQAYVSEIGQCLPGNPFFWSVSLIRLLMFFIFILFTIFISILFFIFILVFSDISLNF